MLAISDLKIAEVQEDDSSKQKKMLQTRVKPALNCHINKLHLRLDAPVATVISKL